MAWLKSQKALGRQIWLCTASDLSLAKAVADHVEFFDGVLASDGQRNMAGNNKATELVRRFGDKGFDYCGNHKVDLAVWRHANAAIVVNAGQSLVTQASKVAKVDKTIAPMPGGIKVVLKALRVHQWAKNALIFVPLAASHRLQEPHTLGNGLLAFLAFSLCASSV